MATLRTFPAAPAAPAIARRQNTTVAEIRAIMRLLLCAHMLKTSLLSRSSYKRRARRLQSCKRARSVHQPFDSGTRRLGTAQFRDSRDTAPQDFFDPLSI